MPPAPQPDDNRSWLVRLFSSFHRGDSSATPHAPVATPAYPAHPEAPRGFPEDIRPARLEGPRPAPASSAAAHPGLPPALSELATGKAPGTTLVFKGSRGSSGPHLHQSGKSQGNDQTGTSWKESRR